jgi:diguanylate cyclase (GGDEF)-like protein/PAS domain S-box-containing protein
MLPAGGLHRRLITPAVVAGAFVGAAALAAYVFLPAELSVLADLTAALLGICLFVTIAGHLSWSELTEKSRRLDVAINHMSQGLLLFDSEERLLVCNSRYIEMYGLSPGVVKPGITLQELLKYRVDVGTFSSDPEVYRADLLAAREHRRTIRSVVELKDGRTILVINQPMADGGWVATHEDITQRVRFERELKDAKSFLNAVIENVPVTIVVKNAHDRRYVLVNHAGERLFGIHRMAMIGKTAEEIFPGASADMITAHDRDLLNSGGELFYDEHPVTTPNNGTRIITSKRLSILGVDSKPQYLIGVIDDVTDRKRAEARIAYMAHHDDLTGLPNRAAFSQHLATTLERAAKSGETFALLHIDLDRFKGINDVFGHAVGDALLREIGRRLQAASEGAFVARLGGDEFTVIVSDGVEAATTALLAERLLSAFDEEFEVRGHRLRVGLSIGVAIYPADGADALSLLGNADAALYRAKSEGRGTIRFFAADLDLRLRERRALQQDLHAAIEHGEFVLHYQPQARMDGAVVGFEALVRWLSPTRGPVPPSTFVPVAEETGLIGALGEWVLREACREASSWANPLRISINLSAAQFRHGDLPSMVHGILLETGLSPQRLELEITESVLIGDHARALAILRRLKALGVQISMDDFGSGYSSLSYLQSFPFDRIKIDQAFISNVERSPQSAAIVRAIIGLGRVLELPVLAEGVENARQLAFLEQEGCHEAQGFYLGAAEMIEHYAAVTGKAPCRPETAALPQETVVAPRIAPVRDAASA